MTCRHLAGKIITACSLLLIQHTTIGAAQPQPYTTTAERCIIPAANYHTINYQILRAILKIESGLKPTIVGHNDNGTTDVGIGQINSMHFKELSLYGITPEHLKDACVGTYIAAWHLRKNIIKYGNTWFGVASYHSATPYFNNRYQILLHNELINANVIPGHLMIVPPLKQKIELKKAK